MISSEAVFLPIEPGLRLCLVHRPSGEPRGTIVFVAPFAEEMNKSRRQVALTARALATSGYVVLLPDLFGCGDSSGDFGDAGWDIWLQDVVAICRWAEQRFQRSIWLWGLRAGALLATGVAEQIPACNLLLWQPVVSGKLHLTQFLRLKVASEALAEAVARAGTKEIYNRLMAGESDEIAGYRLTPRVAKGLDSAELQLPANYRGQVLWCEVANTTDNGLAPRSQALAEVWRNQGLAVVSRVVSGSPFWQTVEISECPGLIDATREMLEMVP